MNDTQSIPGISWCFLIFLLFVCLWVSLRLNLRFDRCSLTATVVYVAMNSIMSNTNTTYKNTFVASCVTGNNLLNAAQREINHEISINTFRNGVFWNSSLCFKGAMTHANLSKTKRCQSVDVLLLLLLSLFVFFFSGPF